jgi:NAD(P)-dependent dehydrogenase (short-subunit alcohol dehydrogenase family)
MDPFQNKIAIVTGGASGIGCALCEGLAGRGALVIVADVNRAGGKGVAAAINAGGGRAQAVRLDVSIAADVCALIEATASQHGRLDYVFNNAGVGISGEMRDLTPEHWRRVLDVNLLGVLYGTRAAYTVMVRQGGGHIVNTASVMGLIGFPTGIPYATTKSAIVSLSTSLREEAAGLGVKVSVVCPGFIQTPIWERSEILKADRQQMLAVLPFKLMDVTRAAHAILRGVARNRAIIVFPFHARLLWWLYRLSPTLLSPLARRTVHAFRASRTDP